MKLSNATKKQPLQPTATALFFRVFVPSGEACYAPAFCALTPPHPSEEGQGLPILN
ncbi:MAG: hypothetical protein LBS01_06155 [Prevotellaceae bacterium]|nr:hypothetical protein [Prevotellaceae bacterium]